MPQRRCGDCRACCIVTGFDAEPGEAPFTKPPNTPCSYLGAVGCTIYAERPPVCRRFACGWLSAPNLPEGLRPDRCGVMFSTNDSPVEPGAYAVFAYELRAGALEGPLPQWLIEEVLPHSTVVVVRAEGEVEVLTADPSLQAKLEQRSEP